jgi:hypothetical protein
MCVCVCVCIMFSWFRLLFLNGAGGRARSRSWSQNFISALVLAPAKSVCSCGSRTLLKTLFIINPLTYGGGGLIGPPLFQRQISKKKLLSVENSKN